jgi:predicted HD superfamily hydrolase involved in NAD metabolism
VISSSEARRLLRERELSAALVVHSEGVAAAARELCLRWGGDADLAEIAGLLHDVCRELGRKEVLRRARIHGLGIGALEEAYPVQLLHGPLAAAELATSDVPPEGLEAIARHTVGGPGMTLVERCVFVADATEPQRAYVGADEARRLARVSLDQALSLVVARDIERLRARDRQVHPVMLALWEELGGDA